MEDGATNVRMTREVLDVIIQTYYSTCIILFLGTKWPRDNDEMGPDMFDCRMRRWYLQAATCRKNIIILIDTSGSMKGLRMQIARSTVYQILDTLTDDDYFNIIKVPINISNSFYQRNNSKTYFIAGRFNRNPGLHQRHF